MLVTVGGAVAGRGMWIMLDPTTRPAEPRWKGVLLIVMVEPPRVSVFPSWRTIEEGLGAVMVWPAAVKTGAAGWGKVVWVLGSTGSMLAGTAEAGSA